MNVAALRTTTKKLCFLIVPLLCKVIAASAY